MPKSKEPINPFYVLSMLFGGAFTVTACAFGLLMLRSTRSGSAGVIEHPLLILMQQHGMAILAIKLLLLAIVAVGAITLDHLRGRREIARRAAEKEKRAGGNYRGRVE
jgi:hypothetical protein